MNCLDIVGELEPDGDGEVEIVERASCRRAAFTNRVEEDVGCLREEGVADPPIGQFTREPEIVRPERSDIDRYVRRRHERTDAAAFAVGERELIDLTVVLDALPGGDRADDVDSLASALHGFVEADSVPPFHHLRPARSDAQHEPSAGE